jgi:membrane protease YdiL (CAAX protease family)
MKWHEVWIWLFQAGLFTFSHIYYINTLPISFWIVVPVISLVLGYLVWRSRTIASSMAAHAMMNGSGNVLGYLMSLYRLG